MTHCQNCGQVNTQASNFCRFCGTKFASPPQPPAGNMFDPFNANPPRPQYQKAPPPPNYEEQPPRPYSWKTDEYQISEDRTKQIDRVQPLASFQPQQHAPMQQYQQHGMTANYQCPRCASRLYPQTQRQISTAGWIVFAVLLVTFFPLFWIGLLIKEDVQTCPICNVKLP